MTPARSPAAPGAARVLVVDDGASNRKLLADLLRREGYEVLQAEGGVEALGLINSTPVDLVLLDLMMPDVGGLAVLTELRDRGAVPSLPVVVITANDSREMRHQALALGATDLMHKPVDQLELACKVRNLVELKSLRDRLKHELREADHLLRLQFDQSPVAIIRWDLDYRVSGWNRAAEAIFGYSLSDALGRPLQFLVPPEVLSGLNDVLTALKVGPAMSTSDNITKSGRRITCDWYNAPLTNADGERIGATSIAVDVSERSVLQAALDKSHRMEAFGQLAGGIAHDFNNLLAVIQGYANFALEGLKDDDGRRADILEVLEASDRAASMTKQLLTFSRQELTTPVPTDLNAGVTQISRLLARTLGEDIVLEAVPMAEPAVVLIDAVRFDQLLLNLAVNARDAMPKGGRLEIRLGRVHSAGGLGDEGSAIRLTVTDTGEGMDAATQQRVFEPFFSTKVSGKGTGLGLATCFAIVSDAGGTIRIDSAPGSGTTFTVDLPECGGARVLGPAPTAAAPRQFQGEVVLVVEDDASLRNVIARLLERAGLKVLLAGDGVEAVGLIDVHGARLAAILTDIVMPRMGGDGVLRHASRAVPDVPVLLTSGYLDDVAQEQLFSGLAILWKPVSSRTLLDALASAIHRRRAGPSVRGHEDERGGAPTVLIVEDDDAVRGALVRVIQSGGYATVDVSSVAAAISVLEDLAQPIGLLCCDLWLADGPCAPILDRVLIDRPNLVGRVLILTGGVVDAAGREVLQREGLAVMAKPVAPASLVAQLAKLQ